MSIKGGIPTASRKTNHKSKWAKNKMKRRELGPVRFTWIGSG